MTVRYRPLSRFLRQYFGYRVHKVPIDAGLSCPNRDGTISSRGCIFCDDLGSGTGAWAMGQGIREQIQRSIERLRHRYKARGFLAYFQAFTNTYAPLERLKALYEEALSVEGVVGLSIGTRPDCVDERVLDLVASYLDRYMVWIEYGLQSAHDETLRRINRGHDFETFKRAVEQTHKRGIMVCAHFILGLPGEGRTEIQQTALKVSHLPIDGVKLHCLYVVKGTHLEDMFRNGLYRPWSQGRYVEAVCDFLERIPATWVIHRLTSDPPREGFLTPHWALDKARTLEMISQRLRDRDTWQGRMWGAPLGALQ